ncbi:MAG: neutral/alkaline non-lysosomal ceramidase N-terminal domain-containing protein [Candidatus Latescibacterota bacterium]
MNLSPVTHPFRKLPFLAFFFAFSILTGDNALAQSWKAGVSFRDITPARAMFTAGYGGRTVPAEGRINPLKVKALAVQDPSGNRVALVTCDIWGYQYDFTRSVAEKAKKLHGLSREQILFNASHTHCGPDIRPKDSISARVFYTYPEQYESRIIPYSHWLEEQFVAAIGEAIKCLEPATLTFSSARAVPFAVSRRFPDGKGGVLYRSNPSDYYTEGDRDDIVPVLKVADAAGKVKAVLFGYACHPITLNEDRFSSDYPGFAQQYIEEAHPGAIALFVQGCAGQLVPNARFHVEYAMGHGRSLALAAGKAIEGEQKALEGPLRTAYEEVELKFVPLDRQKLEKEAQSSDRSVKQKAEWLIAKLDRGEKVSTSLPCPVQVINFGKNLMLVAIGGETVVDYAVAVKKKYPDTFVWAAGYSNYVFSYLPSLKILKEGGYEGSERLITTSYPGPFAADVEERVLAGLDRLVKKVGKE